MNEKTLNGFDIDSGVASVLPSCFAGIWMTIAVICAVL